MTTFPLRKTSGEGQRLSARPVIDCDAQDLEQKVQNLKDSGIHPCLKVLLVGNHPPSLTYTRNKKKFCDRLGIQCDIIHLDTQTNEQTLIDAIRRLNEDPKVHGQFIQLPLPPSSLPHSS